MKNHNDLTIIGRETIIRLLILYGIIILTSISCVKEDEEILPLNHAKGEIIGIFGWCYGEWVMIEVDNPKDIGEPGIFFTGWPENEDNMFKYKNAIGVPYFSKLAHIPDSIPWSVGTKLYFEYRDRTEEEIILFITIPAIICPQNIIAPPANYYMITNIIEYE